MKLTKTMKEFLTAMSVVITVTFVIVKVFYWAVIIASKGIDEVLGR